MPSSETTSGKDAKWRNYNEAREFFDAIKPRVTRLEDLPSIPRGLDLKTKTNVTMMSYPTLLTHFISNPAIRYEYLPDGVQGCLKEKDSCVGYVLSESDRKEHGTGSLMLRIAGFKKENIENSWWVKILLLTVGDVVVYAGIEGTPNGDEKHKEEKHPLGPLEGFKPPLPSFLR